MKKYRISYYYLATGMGGRADTYPEKIIEAESEDKALYEYHIGNGIDLGRFEDFMKEERYVRYWGVSCNVVDESKIEFVKRMQKAGFTVSVLSASIK